MRACMGVGVGVGVGVCVEERLISLLLNGALHVPHYHFVQKSHGYLSNICSPCSFFFTFSSFLFPLFGLKAKRSVISKLYSPQVSL
jgi:hypothetical protein